jgi:amino acid transporter
MAQRSSGQLLRVLGPAFTIAVGLGTVIGGGILRSPATIVDAVPDTQIVVALWMALGVQSLIEANVLAEVLTLWPKSGGVLRPVRAAFGDPGGLLAGWTDWLNNVAAIAALAILSADILALLLPGLASAKVSVAIAVLAGLLMLHLRGVRAGEQSQIIGSAAKTLFLIGVIALIFILVPAAPDVPAQASGTRAPIGWAALVIAYQTIFGAYSGWPNSGYYGGEDADPGRNIPRGMVVTIVTTGALFILVTMALGHALSIEQLRHSELPIADALKPFFGPLAVKIVAAIAAVIVITCCNSNLMTGPRILYALGDERLLPSWVTRVNSGGTPWVAFVLTFLFAAAMAASGSFETVFVIMAALGLVPQILAELSLFKLRRDRPDLARPWRARFYPWLPALAVLLDLALLLGFIVADPTSGLFVVGAAAIALPIGIVMQRRAPRLVS